ncbi:MAG: molybdopterin-dependent oxidoreductase [Hyphomicrobiaceae bacterium]|nr:molybdopterin-dependent oxidoreductase [Hyphomicrobiaceae bacterium]
MTAEPVRTTCPYCGVGCGVLATAKPDGTVDIKGDLDHPANFGRLCSKGSALGETMSLDGRILYPTINGARASWDDALDLVARRFAETIAEHGPESVALYVSGQILTEDYYAANKLVKGYFGTANIDTNSRLCMASSVAGHKRAFGSDTVPGCYDDLECADLVVLVGSNLAWCHPVLFQRLATAREARGTKVVVIDPRRTATCEIADLHLALKPGSDVALFNGLLAAIAEAGVIDQTFIERHTNGFDHATSVAKSCSLAAVATETGLPIADILTFNCMFTATERVVTVYSQGVNQSVCGTDKVNAIINCHLATGRIGKPGTGPFSVTGQPNAMGGRETGGLANMLAAHMELAEPEHRRIVQTFWGSPRIADTPGLKAVDLFRAVGDGRVKAVWIMATNPVDSMPEADAVRAGLEACPFVVVSDVDADTDTVAVADVVLPALAWGEKDGTVTNSERRISRQRAFLPPPGEARADWWQIAQVGQRMGWGASFDWTTAADIFDEYARLTAASNADGRRDLDLGDAVGFDLEAYDAMEPFQWPRRRERLFGDGRYYTPDGRARFVPTPVRRLAATVDAVYPLVLNTGRVRDQWHTMTRTGKAARLSGHIGEPFVEINPLDAARYGISPASIVEVSSRHGSALLRSVVTPRAQAGSVFAPFHWGEPFASRARIDALVSGHVDPVSGQPELKAMPVAVAPFAAAYYAFAVGMERPNVAAAGAEYWALARVRAGWKAELAGSAGLEQAEQLAERLFGAAGSADDVEVLTYGDTVSGGSRFALFQGDMLVGALFVSREPAAVARSWLADRLGTSFASGRDRMRVLAGRPGDAEADKGAIVCACFDVGRNEIDACIRAGRRTTVEVGAATKAGTNCGSCRSEIGRMIEDTRATELVRPVVAKAG